MKFLTFPINPKDGKPDLSNIAIFSSNAEALKAKAFLQRSGLFVIILTANEHVNKDEFVQSWQKQQKDNIISTISNKPNIPIIPNPNNKECKPEPKKKPKV
jgi:hypothetical protein